MKMSGEHSRCRFQKSPKTWFLSNIIIDGRGVDSDIVMIIDQSVGKVIRVSE